MYLQVRNGHCVSHILRFAVNVPIQVTKGETHDSSLPALPQHSECLPRTSGPISKYGGVDAAQDPVDQPPRSGPVHVLLGRLGAKCVIKRVLLLARPVSTQDVVHLLIRVSQYHKLKRE